MPSNSAAVSRWIAENKRSKAPTERLDFLTALAADRRLSKTNAAAVAIYLMHCRNGKTGKINPGMGTISTGAGCTRRTGQTAVQKLSETGWFHIIRSKNNEGRNFSNTYIPIWERVAMAKVAGSDAVDAEHDIEFQQPVETGAGTVIARLGAAAAPPLARSPRTNPVVLNPVNHPSEKEKEHTGSAALVDRAKDRSPGTNANDNRLVQVWPPDGVNQLIATYPSDRRVSDWTVKEYYKAKRMFENEVPFARVLKALQKAHANAFIGSQGRSSMPSLAAWLHAKRWEDADDGDGQEGRVDRGAYGGS